MTKYSEGDDKILRRHLRPRTHYEDKRFRTVLSKTKRFRGHVLILEGTLDDKMT